MKASLAFTLIAAALGVAGCVEPVQTANPYTVPLNSPGTKFSGLPPAVQSTVRAQSGGAEIFDIVKSTSPDLVVYEIIFKNNVALPPLYVAADGSVLNADTFEVAVGAPAEPIGAMSGGAASGMRPGDLPIKVMDTVREKAPSGEIDYIHEVRSGSNQNIYEIQFKDNRPAMIVTEDGTVVRK